MERAETYRFGKARLEGARYYDGVNFARRITVPGWYSFGYNDEVVPPTSSYGLYNSVKAPKTLSLYQMTGHYWYQNSGMNGRLGLFSN